MYSRPKNKPDLSLVWRWTALVASLVAVALLVHSPATPPTQAEATGAGRKERVVVRCDDQGHRIAEAIYGVAFNPRSHRDRSVWSLRPGGRRWGGNPASRFNWRLGNAWNAGADWFFQNVNYTRDPGFSWRDFLTENRQHRSESALTIPLLGWVAKDHSSHGFPVAQLGLQQRVDPYDRDAGNGISASGQRLTGTPARTSIPFTPDDAAAWARTIAEQQLNVDLYLLGNEPFLWHVTHRDVRSAPLGYDELRERLVAYGSAIKRARPDATVAGPGLWGWPAYFYSAVDAKGGFQSTPDRRAHGNVPLTTWLLRELRTHERRTGAKVLDALDVHFYPQARGVLQSDQGGARGAALRVRSTRALWDPTYRDESWIGEPVNLFGRMKDLIRSSYPGLKLVIGEYKFGGEQDISGALALAEALGRFGREPSLLAAFYWTYPPADSPAAAAFQAYRNYDGQGAHFLDWSVPTDSTWPISVHASRNRAGDRLVLVALHLEEGAEASASIELRGCGAMRPARSFRYAAGFAALRGVQTPQLVQDSLDVVLPPQSISVYELAKEH